MISAPDRSLIQVHVNLLLRPRHLLRSREIAVLNLNLIRFSTHQVAPTHIGDEWKVFGAVVQDSSAPSTERQNQSWGGPQFGQAIRYCRDKVPVADGFGDIAVAAGGARLRNALLSVARLQYGIAGVFQNHHGQFHVEAHASHEPSLGRCSPGAAANQQRPDLGLPGRVMVQERWRVTRMMKAVISCRA